MRSLFTLLILFVFANVSAQSKFEIGYYIDQTGTKFEGEIAEISLQNFPSDIKIRKRGVVEIISVDELAYIQYGTLIFEKKSFEYDPSARLDIANFSKEREFNLVNKTAFLQLLVNGEFKLYKYLENGVATYFYENSAQKLTTLKYKKYVEHVVDIKENKEFINQLISDIQGKSLFKEGYYDALKYNDTDLIEYFTRVNGKVNKMPKKSKVQFNLFVGSGISTMDIDFLSDTEAKKSNHFTFSPEIEYILNVNKVNPTAFYLNGKLHSFKNEFTEEYLRENWLHKVDYKAIFVSFGAKQYFLSSHKMKPYGKFGVGMKIPLNIKVDSPQASTIIRNIVLDDFGAGINSGVGVTIFNSLVIEVDYDLLFNNLYINRNNVLNFKIGYAF